jgi:hypothetical protein
MRFFQRIWLILVVGVVFSVVLNRPVFAAGIMVEPAFQFVTITATDSSVTRDITITNQTAAAQVYALSTVDIRQLDMQGQVTFVDKPQNEAKYTLANFLRLPVAELTVEANESKTISVEIVNNQDLSPGGHYGAILAQVISVGGEGEQVVLPTVSSVLLIHKVGGERFHINLKQFKLPFFWFAVPKSMQLQFENQGNVHVVPHGQVVISDIFGRRIAEGIVNEGSVVVMPENLRTISSNVALRGFAIPLVPLVVHIAGSAQPGALQFSQQGMVVYLPILLTLVILIMVIVSFLWVRYAKIKC